MGLDAYVCCTCYRDGMTREPPIPRDHIVIDGTGLPETVWDRLPHATLSVAQKEESERLYAWTDTACEHEFMELASERIGNIAGVAWIRSLASVLDGDRYKHVAPILTGLSGIMDDILPAEEARAALPELDTLMHESIVGSTRTIQEIDGTLIADELDHGPIDYDSFRSLGPSSGFESQFDDLVELGVVGYDFVVRSRAATPLELFRARIVAQSWDHGQESKTASMHEDPVSLVTYRNIETGQHVTVQSFGVSTRLRWPDGTFWDDRMGPLRHYPEIFIVGERNVMLPEMWWTLNSIHRLFVAADRTGNPVVWC